MGKYSTPQEDFWAGEFGNRYINRNISKEILASNLHFFSRALSQAGKLTSCIEFGSNIGMNLEALKLLYPAIAIKAIEINKKAIEILSKLIGIENVYECSILDYEVHEKFDLALIKGVLIHINPSKLSLVYEKLYKSTNKYILIGEYYNPTPMTIKYRGHNNRLFKRDFAGELLEKYLDLRLVDYGFVYRRDTSFPQDDITWFLIEKQ